VRVKRRFGLVAASLVLLVALGVVLVRRQDSLGSLEPYVAGQKRTYARIENPAFGTTKPTIDNYVIKETSLKGLTGAELEKKLQAEFSSADGWLWDFVKDKKGELMLAIGRRNQDEIGVTEIANGNCLLRHQKKAEVRDMVIARVQNWGKDPFPQAPIEVRLGYAVAVD
jgi:hypothetical protein